MPVCGDESWIVALDIPLHLKSVDLFVAIGNFCGVFVDLDWDSWFLPFVRIGIKKTTAIPDVIPLRFDGLEFPIQIVSPAATPLGLPCNTIINAGINSHARVSGTLSSHPVDYPSVGASSSPISSPSLPSRPNKPRAHPNRIWVRKAGPIWLPPHSSPLIEPILSLPSSIHVPPVRAHTPFPSLILDFAPSPSRSLPSLCLHLGPDLIILSNFALAGRLLFSPALGATPSPLSLSTPPPPSLPSPPSSPSSPPLSFSPPLTPDSPDPYRDLFEDLTHFDDPNPLALVPFQPINDAYLKDWGADLDLHSIIAAGLTLRRLLNFSSEVSSEQVEDQFEELAFSFKSKKRRATRSKLQMEIHGLGPVNLVLNEPRRKRGPSCSNRCGFTSFLSQ
ncbi:unnamed protein product [Linum trigynum]|uniref:Uncharacterized protein n=1 Tax=Linum trigynum TaxID=586398 RepID=A0AAV2DAQ3_9ROSI